MQKDIHDSLVMLMEQDIPMNYEEAMVDLNKKYDYESWNPILLESMGYSLWLIQMIINVVTSSNPAFEEVL